MMKFTRPELTSWHGLARIWLDPGATQQYYPVTHTAFWQEGSNLSRNSPVSQIGGKFFLTAADYTGTNVGPTRDGEIELPPGHESDLRPP